MAELEPFEMRLQSALRRYLADAPVEVDAAGVTRRVRAEGPGRGILPAFRPFALSPALAWLLLALLLVAALVGALLVAGSQRRPLPAVVPPAAVLECPPGSMPDEPGPLGQARPPVGASVVMVFDRRAGEVVAFVSDSPTPGLETWTFDVCSNTWARPVAPDTAGAGPTWLSHVVYHAASGLTIAIEHDGTLWTYELAANRWTARTPAPAPFEAGGRLVYDPVSSLVFALPIPRGDGYAGQKLWSYDLETDAWTEVAQSGAWPWGSNGDWVVAAYDASVDRIVTVGTGGRADVRLFDPRTGDWTASSASAPALLVGWFAWGGEIAYDEASRRIVVAAGGSVRAYDAAADRWEPRGPDMPSAASGRVGGWTVYDPLSERIVIAGGGYMGDAGQMRSDDVWAIDAASGEATQLLAPSRIERYDAATQTFVEVPEASPD